ncbi:head-tail connector protein [uncultured Xylophilus sp.]|uniref:head-tail connector protein n=1 Tax=uncultured Xylophilus sp. TaxID=296832 RepID=UPI0026014B19|nr:head-tail connector protein [uncultured Xylophilus sp.]
MLVTPDEARTHLREEADYPIDAIKLGAATEYAQQFLNRRVYPDAQAMAAAVLDGSAGKNPMLVNDLIKAAILLIFAHLNANREDTVSGAAVTEIPMGSKSLLWPHRVGLGV